MIKGAGRGAYTADRAAALSGVPRSTVHYWARNEILVPSVSPSKVKLWSYTDLMGLRTISWLRHRKASTSGWDVPATTMPAVRRALATLAELDVELWTEEGGHSVRVDPNGEIFILADSGAETLDRARPLDEDMLDLIEPFQIRAARGPDLQRPRPIFESSLGSSRGPHTSHTAE